MNLPERWSYRDLGDEELLSEFDYEFEDITRCTIPAMKFREVVTPEKLQVYGKGYCSEDQWSERAW
jgi:hypothetical protein